jgi:hypothetical protein
MCVNYFEPQRLWAVHRFEGMDNPRRVFGNNMGKAEALKRAALVGRLFPEMASPRVTPSVG